MKQYIIQLGSIGDGLITLPSILVLKVYSESEQSIFIGLGSTGRLFRQLGLIDACLDRDTDIHGLEADANRILFTRGKTLFNPDIKVIRADETKLEPFWLQYIVQTEDILSVTHMEAYQYTKVFDTQRDIISRKIGIGFGSGSWTKIWDIVNYLEIAKHLKYKGFEPVFIGGEVEREEPDIIELIEGQGFKVILFNELTDTFEFSQNLCFFISNDSGLAHLCSLAGLSGLIIYNNRASLQSWSPYPIGEGQRIYLTLGKTHSSIDTQCPIVSPFDIDINQSGFPEVKLILKILEEALLKD